MHFAGSIASSTAVPARRPALLARKLQPDELVFGGIWIGPGGGDRGDGNRPDPGQPVANAV
eukprot:9426173-Alexandrium_andersonii.AAC.1